MASVGVALSLVGCGRTDLIVSTGLTAVGDGLDGPEPMMMTTGPGTTTLPSDGAFTETAPAPTSVGPDTDGPAPCEIDAQCVPAPDPCIQTRCEFGVCIAEPLDKDGDGFSPAQCEGGDCNDLNPNTFPGADENCFDGDDNDCNGVFDCFDPVCQDVRDCGCTPTPGGEVCGNGIDDDCDTTVDCNDADCLGTPACGCAATEGGACTNGFDDDCDDAIDCDDTDCASNPTCQCMGAFEHCGDGQDNDCDLLIDCADPDCEGLFPCTCVGAPVPEVCDNGADDDCDSMVDCADPDCAISPSCMHCSTEICTGGLDEDCDQFIDCADDACVFDQACAPTPEECNNGLDDDGDQRIDCDDPDCVGVPVCVNRQATCLTALTIPGTGTYFGSTSGNDNNQEGSCGGAAGEAIFRLVLVQPSRLTVDSIGTSFDSVVYVRAGACVAGTELGCDDDSAGNFAAALDFTLLYPGVYFIFLDGYTIDPFGGANEGPFQLNVQVTANPAEICGDGIDNDGDVYVDCADPDCAATPPCATCLRGGPASAEFGVGACTDGVDNDCDGTTDCGDDDCSASEYYVTECCNGIDENGNGTPDDFNCRCASDGDCGDGQICYDHSANTCGRECPNFFGDVCPFVAPGALCNEATGQCEFP